MDGELKLRSVRWLLDKSFIVPSYQRGYRWQAQQVLELLTDLAEFARPPHEPDEFYCLQPIVVTPSETHPDHWEVIDGQQRLTTLHLILGFLETQLTGEGLGRFSLQYVTREHSAEFLERPDPKQKGDYIDFAHMWDAWTTIEEWFTKTYKGTRGDFLGVLIRSDGYGPNVRVIWYELPDSDKPIEVFRRLNIGKISLTNAELIRALFLSRTPRENREAKALRLRIAYQWDDIERRLQDDAFWYYVHEGQSDFATRIEYLFAILMLRENQTIKLGEHGLFLAYQKYAKKRGGDLGTLWQEVRDLHLALEEWYEDETLDFYHLVGTAVTLKTWGTTPSATSEEVIVDLLRRRQGLLRSELDEHLRRTIFDQVFPRLADSDTPFDRSELEGAIEREIGKLAYPDDPRRRPIRGVLLLFNVATLMRHGSNQRFRFDLFKSHTKGWDIEHIRSVESSMPRVVTAQRRWLDNVLDYWSEQRRPDDLEQRDRLARLRERVESFRAARTHDRQAFIPLYLDILAHFGERESEDVDNGIGNLALLDAATNRSYGNAVFPIKRREITRLDSKGVFTPPCTTNAFLKYYTRHPSDMFFWKTTDRDDYRGAIVRELLDFFCPEEPATP